MKRPKPRGFGKRGNPSQDPSSKVSGLRGSIELVRQGYPQFRNFSDDELGRLCSLLDRALKTSIASQVVELIAIFDLENRTWAIDVNCDPNRPSSDLAEEISSTLRISKCLITTFPCDFLKNSPDRQTA